MSRPEPRWLGRLAIEQAHFRQIREHGGSHGLRDENVLESALARPQQRWNYDPTATIFELAASYEFGLAMNHPFVDGNKRVGLATCLVSLKLNGIEIAASDDDLVDLVLGVTEGRYAKSDVAVFLARHAAA